MDNQKKRNGRVIAFYNRKGGVGKTTLSGNFAALLAKKIRKDHGLVLFLDLDSQMNSATTYLGLDKDDLTRNPDEYPNVLNLVGIDAPSLNVKIPKLPLSVLVRRVNFNLRTIAPSDQMDLLWKKTPAYSDDYSIFMDAFQELRTEFDWIVIDLPPAQDDMTYSALAASDYLIIPAECDLSSVSNLSSFFKDTVPTFQSINPSFKVLGIVANKTDRYSDSFYDTNLTTAAKKYGTYLYKTKIRTSTGLKDPNNAEPSHKRSLRNRSGVDRCVVACDNFIFRNYRKAYDDVNDFTDETIRRIKAVEKKGAH